MVVELASLVVVSSGDYPAEERFELRPGTFRIGTGLNNDLVLEGEELARSHATITGERGRWRLVSAPGVRLGGRVVHDAWLANGNELELGGHRFRFVLAGARVPISSASSSAASSSSASSSTITRSGPIDTWSSLSGSLPVESDGTRFLATARFDTADPVLDDADIPRRYETLRRAFRAVDALMHVVDLSELSRRVVDAAVEVAAPETARVLLVEPGGGLQERETRSTLRAGETLPPVSRTVMDHVLRHQETVLALDAQSDDRWQSAASVQDSGVLSLVCVPLLRAGRVYGLLYLTDTSRSSAFTQADLELLSAIGAGAGMALANAHLYAEVQALARSQQRFVPQQFLRALGREDIRSVEPGIHVEKQLSVLFSDLRGFTPLTERIGAAATIELLNRYFVSMEPAINANGGFIDEFAGDAIMALFDTAAGAVAAGVAMFRALESFNAESAQVSLQMGAGINTGPLMLGTVGGRDRLKCGVVGDAVNLAARIESVTKQYGVSLLIGDHTRAELGASGAFHLRSIDRVRLVGRSAPTELFQVLEAEREPAPMIAELERYQDAVAAFYERRFEEAARGFEAGARVLPDDVAIRRYVERCRRAIAEGVGENWDGIDTLRIK